MIDVWSSMGLRLPRELDFPSDIDLPAEETHFLSLSPHWITSPSSVPGIWAEMSRLARIWSEIQELNKASVDQHLSPLQLQTFVDALAHKLDSWDSNLPPFLVETSQNLEHYSSIGQGTSFAALHLGFHYYNEVLFYQFLAHGDNQPAKAYADRCTRHAAAFCDLLYLCEAIPGCGCLYVMVGHMLTVTSTVYMHVLLFSAEDARIVTAESGCSATSACSRSSKVIGSSSTAPLGGCRSSTTRARRASSRAFGWIGGCWASYLSTARPCQTSSPRQVVVKPELLLVVR